MKLHKNGTKIGRVIFTSNGNKQRMEAYLKGDPDVMTEGYHGLHIHSNPVKRNDCSATSTGGYFNPERNDHGELFVPANSRHLGDIVKVRAGERGEVNHVHKITVDPLADEVGTGMIEPILGCPAEPFMLWPDGREEKIVDLEKAEKKRKRALKKGKPTYSIVLKEPDCYQPVWNRDTFTLNDAKFALEGKNSIVGKAVVVLQGKEKRGGDGIACCTLKLVDEED